MNKRGTGVFLTIIFAMTVFGQADLPDPKPTKAVEELINVFDRFLIVALGEIHWSLNRHEFIAALIKHPAFAKKVNDIVVEFGSAKYQPIMDRYTAGETVARTELQQVWRNTTQTKNWRRTPLMYAASYNRLPAVWLLLEAGANVNARDKSGMTALDLAKQFANQEIIRLLQRAGALHGAPKKPGASPVKPAD